MQHLFTDFPAELANFGTLLSQPKRILITTHQNPDADALGSSLGLKQYLEKKGHQVVVVTPTDFSEYIAWLPQANTILNFEGSQQKNAIKEIQEAEIIFCLDFSALGRIKDMEKWVRTATATKILIDHHQQPEDFADFVFWNDTAAATCELIYQLLERLGETDLIDTPTAECLYAGLVTDTGSFRFDATSAEVHRIAGELIKKGVRTNQVHRKLFDGNTLSRQRLLGHILANNLVVLPEYRASYMSLSLEELEKFSSDTGDTEGFVNFGLALKDVVMSAIFIERKDHIKLSFRSVEDFSVSQLARDHFKGGGHKNAAGGRSEQTLQATIEQFISLLPQYKTELQTIQS